MNPRRDFIKKTSGLALGYALSASASSYARILGSNDRIKVGLVGFADRSKGALIPSFLQHAKELNFEIAALSDIWSLRRAEGAAHMKSLTGIDIKLANNNDALYAMKDIDAVIISTADFQHAYHGIEAVRAGRDAYVEKPLANTMEDARAILKAVKETGKIVQIGTQRRSGANYELAKNFISEGKFGQILNVELTWNVNQPGRWRRPQLVEKVKETDIDWKRFLVNRPFEAFDPRKFVEYRLFWPYSSGIPCQWMVHQIDTVHWFTGIKRPKSVVANGGLYCWKDGRKNFDSVTIVFDYEDAKGNGFQVSYGSRMFNSAGGTKEVYFSNGGTLDLSTNKISALGGLEKDAAAAMGMSPNLLQEQSLDTGVQVVTSSNTGADPLTSAHMRNWMQCVRDRKKPNADVEAGYNHSVALCMTIAAMQTGKKVGFDDQKQEVVFQ